MNLTIAFVGPVGSGKDMVAQYLVAQHGFRRFAFADRIKQEYYAASGHTEEEFKAARGTPLETEIRKGLWAHSVSVCRMLGDTHFVDIVIADVVRHSGPSVITDVRTPEELRAVRGIEAKLTLVLKDCSPCWLADKREVIPDTRLTFGDLGNDFRIFRNIFKGMEIAHEHVEQFYQDLVS